MGYKTVNEASEALRLLNRKTFDGGRYRLRVQFALTPEEKAKRKKEQEASRKVNGHEGHRSHMFLHPF